MVEGHRATGTSGRKRPENGDITELFGKRDKGLDDAGPGGIGIHRQDLSAATVQVADDVSHILLGGNDFQVHDGLEQHRLRLVVHVAESQAGRNLEGECVGVHRVETAVEERDLEGLHLVAGQEAVGYFYVKG